MLVDFDGKLWLWDVRQSDSWTFVTLPAADSAVIAEMPALARGFGSVRVQVTIGNSRWRTSIFPDARSGCYALPIKKSVRLAEQIEAGDRARVQVELVDL